VTLYVERNSLACFILWLFVPGIGVYQFPSDDSQGRVKFEGQLKNGLPNGHGILLYKVSILPFYEQL